MNNKNSKLDKRAAPRRDVSPLTISSMSSLENLTKIARFGEITQASTSGLRVVVSRIDLVPASLRKSLNIDSVVGERVILHLPQMNLEISGTITRTKLIGKEGFEIGIDFSDDAPEYWRECLVELLPIPGELD